MKEVLISILKKIRIPIIIIFLLVIGVTINNKITKEKENDLLYPIKINSQNIYITVNKDGTTKVEEIVKLNSNTNVNEVKNILNEYSDIKNHIANINPFNNDTRGRHSNSFYLDVEDFYTGNTETELKVTYLLQTEFLNKYKDVNTLSLDIFANKENWQTEEINIFISVPNTSTTMKSDLNYIKGEDSFKRYDIQKETISNNQKKYTLLDVKGINNLELTASFDANSTTQPVDINQNKYSNYKNENIDKEETEVTKNLKKSKQEEKAFFVNLGDVFQDIIDTSFYDEFSIVMICIIVITSVFIAISIARRKLSSKVNYYRNVEDIPIPPYMSSVIASSNIKMKNIIMSTILDLNTRGNIKIIDKNSFVFISMNGLDDIEQKILILLFGKEPQEGEMLNLKEFSTKKLNSNIIYEFSKIKEDILKKLADLGIFTERKSKLSLIFNSYAIFNIIMCAILIANFEDIHDTYYIIFLFKLTIISICTYYGITIGKLLTFWMKEILKENRGNKKNDMKFTIALSILLVIALILKFLIWNEANTNLLAIVIIMSYALLKIPKEEYVKLRKNSKIENNLIGLKKYLEDYSLIKNKSMAESIIWEKYLSYAIALDINNKQINKLVNDEMINLNINLQFIDYILGEENEMYF